MTKKTTYLHAVVQDEGDGREGLELLLRQAHQPRAVLHARRLSVVCFEVVGLVGQLRKTLFFTHTIVYTNQSIRPYVHPINHPTYPPS